jgi:pSer/pThr/pTyr-binding forkhead associated (FHA) protein
MGFIHYKCLKQCIKVRITKKEADNYICYLWKNYECEICLEEYPKYIKYKSHIYDLIEYSIPYQEYLIFDYTLFDDSKKKTNRKGIIIVKINDEENITIGRNQSNIIKLKDISVSRNHCYIFKKENKIYVADKSSKFGTLLYVNRPFTLTNNPNIKKTLNNINTGSSSFIDNQVNLVSGKNYFGFKMDTSWSFFGNLFSNTFCCKCKNSDEEFVLNLDTFKDYEDDRILEIDHSNDSYLDYCINLDTIIKNGENNSNNNNSFI